MVVKLPPNTRLKLTAPVGYGRIPFVIIVARRRSLGAPRWRQHMPRGVTRTRTLAAALSVIALLPTSPAADVTFAIIEYRVLQRVGQVRLTTGFVHDPATQMAMFADLESFDRQGIILIAGGSVRHFNRRETIGSHTVETAISVYPAVGHGYRGGLATADVIVTVDGRKKIDCPYDQGPIELAELDILPLEDMISITGSYDDKEVRGGISLDSTQTIDTPWLERHVR